MARPQLLKLNQELTWRVLTQDIRPQQSKGSLLVLGSLTLQRQHLHGACLPALCGTQIPVDSLQPVAVLLYQGKLLSADQKAWVQSDMCSMTLCDTRSKVMDKCI